MNSILGDDQEPLLPPSDGDLASLCLANIRRAARGDWKASAWLLSHHPATSGYFSDAAVAQRIERDVMSRTIRAIAGAGLPRDFEQQLLLHLAAAGVRDEGG